MACCPTQYTVCVARGGGGLILWTFTQSDETTPLDLTGYTFKEQVRDPSDVATLTYLTADMTIDTAAGTVEVILSPTDTLSLTAGVVYITDLLVIPPTGDPYVSPVQYVFDVYTPATRAA